MQELIEAIRVAVATEASAEQKAIGVQACRTIVAALDTEPGKPIVLPGMTMPAPTSRVSVDQIIDLMIGRLTTIAAQRDAFLADLLASIAASTKRHHLDVLPGAADRGDVDPTSSTVALSPGGLLGTLPDALVRNTFERYWRDFTTRRDSGQPWDGYTPYEWRNVGSLVRLGQRERALQAMAYFYLDRRPAGWNQWAEVVLRDAREPRFLGDMPHGWVASDQIRSVLDLFAYEHEGERAMVLAAGVPLAWFDGPGLSLQGLRTPYGRLGWYARARTADARTVMEFALKPLRTMPPGGILLRGPWPKASRVWVDGRAVEGAADKIRLLRAPARVRIEWVAND